MIRLYTDEQCETVVTKFSSNFHQAFSLLLACFVFYASHSIEIIKDKTNDIIIFIIGGLEIFYISCVVIDIYYQTLQWGRCYRRIHFLLVPGICCLRSMVSPYACFNSDYYRKGSTKVCGKESRWENSGRACRSAIGTRYRPIRKRGIPQWSLARGNNLCNTATPSRSRHWTPVSNAFGFSRGTRGPHWWRKRDKAHRSRRGTTIIKPENTPTGDDAIAPSTVSGSSSYNAANSSSLTRRSARLARKEAAARPPNATGKRTHNHGM